jgi:hypothetical protein
MAEWGKAEGIRMKDGDQAIAGSLFSLLPPVDRTIAKE